MDFLVVDDDKTFRDATCMVFEDEGHYAQGVENGDLCLRQLKEEKYDGVMLDLNLGRESGLDVLKEINSRSPNVPVVLFSAEGSVGSAVEAMRLGAIDFLEKPFTRQQLHTVLARVERYRQLGQRVERLEEDVREARAQNPMARFDFSSPAMQDVMRVLERAASTPAAILILGESGTGKSVLARQIHDRSNLADKPFVTVSCPSLSRELLESELFGHVRGAFTGAIKDHWGKVKAASGGTLFLDEIGDLPMEIQPKLLRLLQEREYERLGENATRKAEVRVIAATNRNLEERVKSGEFREDLFFRLNVISVAMPPLRERMEDLLSFARHYLEFFNQQCGREVEGFDDEALEGIKRYSWPGNLRQLRNALERSVILAEGSKIAPRDLPIELHKAGGDENAVTGATVFAGARISLQELEDLHLKRILASTDSLAEASEILGIDQTTLYRKRKRLGIA